MLMMLSEKGNYQPVRQFTFLGQKVCHQAFLILTGVSKAYVRRLMTAIESGALQPPTDGRTCRTVRDQPQRSSVDSFFDFCYWMIAEPLAETLTDQLEPDTVHASMVAKVEQEAQQPVVDPTAEWILAGSNPVVAASKDMDEREQRWLPHCRIADLYEQYCLGFVPQGQEPASSTLFYKLWREHWAGILRIRKSAQHARCQSCVLYSEYRAKARSEEVKESIQKAYTKHLAGVFADRDLGRRMALQSEQSNQLSSPLPHSKRTLYVCLDGMDQAKFKLPRHKQAQSGKVWETLHRPALHNILVLIHGVCECYFLMNLDQKKDSNCQCTVLCGRAIDIAATLLQSRNMCLPSHWVIQADNTPREGRNQWLALWAGHMVASARAASISLCFYRVGHTHNEVDQRFSMLASIMNRANVIQTPQELKRLIESEHHQVKGREIFAEIMPSSFNFQSWLSPMGVSLTGMVYQEGLTVNHVFRVVRRGDLQKHAGSEKWTVTAPAAAEVDDQDAILLTKHWMSSSHLSQNPILLVPKAQVKAVQPADGPPHTLPNNEMTDSQRQQFERTAKFVEKPPWHMTDASDYLRGLCHRSEHRMVPAPEPLVLYQKRPTLPAPDALTGELSEEWKDFAPDSPRLQAVQVHPVAPKVPKANQKRPNNAQQEDSDPEVEQLLAVQQAELPPRAKARGRPKGQPKAPPAMKRPAGNEAPVPKAKAKVSPPIAKPPAPSVPPTSTETAGPPSVPLTSTETAGPPLVPPTSAETAKQPPPQAKGVQSQPAKATEPVSVESAKAKPKQSAKAKPAAVQSAKAKAKPVAAQAAKAKPKFGCSKCRFARGCSTCKNYRPEP
ncbi:unnamed protein product [Effrenium voratum]|nr:unnamed protein product [Effrenium voratum]